MVLAESDGRPLAARVWLVGARTPSRSNPQGTFRFEALTPGRYHLRATYIGYVPIDTVLSVAAGAQIRLTLRLTSSPVELSSMTIREAARPPEPVKKPVPVPPKPKLDCGQLFVISMKMSLCSSPAMFPRIDVYQEKTFQGLNARIREAAQEAVARLGFVTERLQPLNDRTWQIVAHDRGRFVEAGSTMIEMEETGADDTTIRISTVAPVPKRAEALARARLIITTMSRDLR